MFRHVNRESAPAAAGFDDAFAGLELNFAADVIHLGDLRFFERSVGRREIRTGVNEMRVEPELVEIDVEIVMAVNIFRGAAKRIVLGEIQPARDELEIPFARVRVLHGARNGVEESDEIAFDANGAVGVAVAESHLRMKMQAQERAAIGKKNSGDRTGAGRRGFGAIGENKANWRIAERGEAFAQKTRVE